MLVPATAVRLRGRDTWCEMHQHDVADEWVLIVIVSCVLTSVSLYIVWLFMADRKYFCERGMRDVHIDYVLVEKVDGDAERAVSPLCVRGLCPVPRI